MKSFILEHMDDIVRRWEEFARTLTPAATTMDSAELRDHAKEMLEAIAKDIQTPQTDRQQAQKSKGWKPPRGGITRPAAAHGLLRQQVGFDLAQLVAEFRALRASVLKIWVEKEQYRDADSAYEITRFNEAIDEALAESVDTYSKELSRSRDTFLGILGHDLRSPLGAISNVLPQLANAKGQQERENALTAGRRSVAAMGSMIDDLLEYTRTRLGQGIPVVQAPSSLDELCKAAISEMSLVYPQTAFRYESGDGLDGLFDADRMHQVISNLLNNAVEHGRAGTSVTVVAAREPEGLVVRVSNAGSPIPVSELETIFEPMLQGSKQGKEAPRTSRNFGLGLFIAREIVQAHDGTIEVASSVERGTTFTVKLPQRLAETSAAA